MKKLTETPEFYRKFVGLVQLSSIPVTVSINDKHIVVDFPDDPVVPLLTLTQKEWNEWSSERILNIAGVELNDVPEKIE